MFLFFRCPRDEQGRVTRAHRPVCLTDDPPATGFPSGWCQSDRVPAPHAVAAFRADGCGSGAKPRRWAVTHRRRRSEAGGKACSPDVLGGLPPPPVSSPCTQEPRVWSRVCVCVCLCTYYILDSTSKVRTFVLVLTELRILLKLGLSQG